MKKKYAALQKKVDQKINQLRKVVKSVYGVDVKPTDIKYDLFTTRTGGMAVTNHVTKKQDIRLHPAALLEYGEKYIEETVVHEYAHIVSEVLQPRCQSHGKLWKTVMVFLGGKPDRCHEYNLSECLEKHAAFFNIKASSIKKKTTYEYSCSCGMPHHLGPQRHKKVQLGTASYVCARCKGRIALKAQEAGYGTAIHRHLSIRN